MIETIKNFKWNNYWKYNIFWNTVVQNLIEIWLAKKIRKIIINIYFLRKLKGL